MMRKTLPSILQHKSEVSYRDTAYLKSKSVNRMCNEMIIDKISQIDGYIHYMYM